MLSIQDWFKSGVVTLTDAQWQFAPGILRMRDRRLVDYLRMMNRLLQELLSKPEEAPRLGKQICELSRSIYLRCIAVIDTDPESVKDAAKLLESAAERLGQIPPSIMSDLFPKNVRGRAAELESKLGKCGSLAIS